VTEYAVIGCPLYATALIWIGGIVAPGVNVQFESTVVKRMLSATVVNARLEVPVEYPVDADSEMVPDALDRHVP
jgi:hypothetical protein